MGKSCKAIHSRLYKNIFSKLCYGETDNKGTPAKFCATCVYFIFTNSLRCECCGSVYRISPRNKPSNSVKKTRALNMMNNINIEENKKIYEMIMMTSFLKQ
jgi:hypothetical protein